ncbi:MAG: hypothetical protein JNK02_12285 [Planctomycetes bacterium]|nr:hypothetical protein [Planctomycetota bacterium]
MLRSTLTLAGLVALGAAAQANGQSTNRVQPITGAVRDGGVYHVATNTWTRKASQVNIGADIIYNNTSTNGYYSPLSDDIYVDEGRIPSPSSPNNLSSKPGCAPSYTINGVQIAYCTDEVAGGQFTINFFQSYAACSTSIGPTPTGTVAFTGGPGAPAQGTLACWILTLDLDGPPSTAFAMQADGDGTYAAPDNSNLFGWAMRSTLPAGTQINTGPFIAGDPNVALRWDGTIWDPTPNLAEAGFGMGTLDQWRIEGGPTNPGCYFFGGFPFASFWLELYANACGPVAVGTAFCFGDGSGTACPCANNGNTGNGCANSLFTAGANIAGVGTASISADTVVLTATNVPNSSVLFFQGTTQQSGGAGAVFGDGKRCAGGTVIRLGTKNASANTTTYPQGGDPSVSVRGLVVSPGTRTYQAWYRNAAAFCTAATFNLSNGLEISWGT